MSFPTTSSNGLLVRTGLLYGGLGMCFQHLTAVPRYISAAAAA